MRTSETTRQLESQCMSMLMKVVIPTMLLSIAADVAAAQTDSRGLYVYSWDVANTFSPTQTKAPGVAPLLAAMNTPGIDGITLVFDWNAIEPGQRTFLWTNATQPTLLDEWIHAAIDAGIANHKPFHVDLAIRAGFGTPCWLFNPGDCPTTYRLYNPSYTGNYSGAPALDLFASAHQGRGKCLEVIQAPPWDQTFQDEWEFMLTQLSAYLKQSPTYQAVREYNVISTVRIDGLNRTTDEFRLPAEVLSTQAGATCDADAVHTWLSAGYRPALILKAWDQLTDDIAASFSDKIVNVAIIPTNSGNRTLVKSGNGQFPFPPIDEKGCVYLAGIPTWARSDFSGDCTVAATEKVPDQNLGLIALASRKLAGRLTVEFENLHVGDNGQPAPASPTVVRDAEEFGLMPGFQTNNYLGQQGGGTSCSSLTDPERCSPSQYLAMLDTGITPNATDLFLHSQILEVFYPDIDSPPCAAVTNPPFGCGYPDEIAQGHRDLINPPMVTIAIPPATTQTHWYTSLPLTGEVSANSAVGEVITDLQCTEGATGSGAGGFSITVKKQGGPVRVVCQATDAAGHMGESVRALWIDDEAPVTTASVKTLLNGAVQITLAATDNVSGVARTGTGSMAAGSRPVRVSSSPRTGPTTSNTARLMWPGTSRHWNPQR